MKTTFKELKTRAKTALGGKYWYAFGVCLLASLLMGILTSISSFMLTTRGVMTPEDIPAGTVFISYALTIANALLVIIPLTVGLARFFIKSTSAQAEVGELFFPYKNRLCNVIGISFLRGLYVYLWSLLFIIPGIIKSFQYSMIEYILADNPAVGRKKAFELTKALTAGNKWRIFCFGLSFIGWILLGVITLGIGLLFLEPYIQAAYVQLYFDLKTEAIEKGTVSAEDFAYNTVQ